MPSTDVDFRSVVCTGLIGRDTRASVVAALLAVPIAISTALWVGTTVGADQFAERAVSTWSGESLHLIVISVATALVLLGAVSSGLNSGLLPTYLLVASPLFGIGLARYGTEYSVLGSTHVVSLGEAFADGAGVAIAIGFPIAVGGFLLGIGLRYLLADRSGGSGGTHGLEGI